MLGANGEGMWQEGAVSKTRISLLGVPTTGLGPSIQISEDEFSSLPLQSQKSSAESQSC